MSPQSGDVSCLVLIIFNFMVLIISHVIQLMD